MEESRTTMHTISTVNQPLILTICRLLWRYLPWLPPLITLTLVLSLHIDVPYYDQWDLLPLLDAHYQHQLNLLAFLQPHNGHILFLPRIVMLALALLTHWNTLAEVLFTFVCMLANWYLLQRIGAHLLIRPLSIVEQLLLSLVTFSLAQAQNWLWGWQLQIPLALLFTLLGFLSLISIRSNTLALLSAMLCGIAAALSFAGCLPYWLAAAPLIWQRQPKLIVPWLLFSCISLLIYASLLGTLTSGNNPLPPLSDTLRHTRNTLAILGNLGARYGLESATATGAVLLGIAAQQYRRLSLAQRSITLSLILFAIGSSLLVSISRAGLGDEQMLATRYGTLTLPLWLISILLMIDGSKNRQKTHRCIVLTVLILVIIGNSVYSFQDWQQMHRRLMRGSEALTNINNATGQHLLPRINPRRDQAQAIREVKLLQQYHLSFYRHPTNQPAITNSFSTTPSKPAANTPQ